MQWLRGELVFKAHRLCVSLNSRLESNKEDEEEAGCESSTPRRPCVTCPKELPPFSLWRQGALPSCSSHILNTLNSESRRTCLCSAHGKTVPPSPPAARLRLVETRCPPLNPKPSTLNLNPKPSILNPQTLTLNHKP